jgi:hypothetical protein
MGTGPDATGSSTAAEVAEVAEAAPGQVGVRCDGGGRIESGIPGLLSRVASAVAKMTSRRFSIAATKRGPSPGLSAVGEPSSCDKGEIAWKALVETIPTK